MGWIGHEKIHMNSPRSLRRTPPIADQSNCGLYDASTFHFKARGEMPAIGSLVLPGLVGQPRDPCIGGKWDSLKHLPASKEKIPSWFHPPTQPKEDEVLDFRSGTLCIIESSIISLFPYRPNNYNEACEPYFLKKFIFPWEMPLREGQFQSYKPYPL